MMQSPVTPTDTLDGGPRRIAAGSERLCAATGEVRPVEDMIRFVVGPGGVVVPDLKRKLPGRGIWITATRAALTRAVGRRAFARSFRRDVGTGEDLPGLTDSLLAAAALDALSMAHKARRVVQGFVRVERAIARERLLAVVHAADAARDGVRKLEAALHHRVEDGHRAIPVFTALGSAELDLALGRSNVVHAALLAGPESETFVARAKRLVRFRTGDVAAAPASEDDRRH
ncbi:MAG TPA: RNA-binding protein [Xanthobacteraceae bacterium]|nr:RNA-binding protein [Xanthobacteraceae bacterium]